ncbi:12622_t:CDS:2 [Gigaspora margarita]|uniref:12622_t:CDS:1 n=1 Tax=Gigaspora margarita TaxID=4874 RepID=A0ABN7V3F1_GIGMA|nr:12622_t:CDS:2 [Gigaspora margarita]
MNKEKTRQEKLHFKDVKEQLLEFCNHFRDVKKQLLEFFKQSRHSYLYTEPFEPVVHGTFGIDQPKTLDVFIIRKIEDSIQIISDFFTEIIAGSHGFGHPCHDGDMSNIIENDKIDSKLVKVDDWKTAMKKRINENKIYDVTFTPPEDGSVNIDKFIEFHKTLENHLNYQPIKWDLILLDNLLDLHPPDNALKQFKTYLETQEKDKASDLSKEDSDLSSNMNKIKKYHREIKKHSRRSRYSKNLLSMAQNLKDHNLREAFFKITKLTKTDLCNKDIFSIIEEFVKIRLVFKIS